MQQSNSMRGNTQAQQIDIAYIARSLFQNLYIIIICSWIGLLIGFMTAGYLNKPLYQSDAYLMIRSKENSIYILYDTVVKKVASQYKKTFTGSAIKAKVKEITGNNEIEGQIKAECPEGTNILVVSATSKNPMDAFTIVKIATENCTQLSDYYITDYFLEELKEPSVPNTPVHSVSRKKSALFGAIIGFCLSAGIIALVNLMKNDVKNEKQMDELIDADRFATIFFERKKGKNKKKGILLKYFNTGFLFSESIRKMAAKFSYQARKKGIKVLMVTSVMENEGKSTVAANLALALAGQNKKVLLIDADFRHPSLYQLFEKKLSKEQEIMQYLTGVSSLQDVLTREEISGLYYLFGTESYRDSDKILRTEKMQRLIRSAKEQMDYVIIDTAPMSVSNDAEVLSHLVDSAMLIIRQGYSRIPSINDALDLLYENNVDVTGCVYNAVETHIIPGLEEHGYYYAYGYGYGKYYKNYKK